MRLDRLLVYLRFARTRSMAKSMILSGQMRINSARVTKISCEVAVGDVLTFALRGEICVARIEKLPDRRLSPAQAAKAWSRAA
ncbi:S4 domain-containing protein [Erythrobacter sp. KY5]|uniref:S4 domain-containing protein n=1 Tax=Erythrobacter sp. KY5 TaxID=2011159 RepID=UPI0013A6B560|nr:S4 domain-containing protein [Erythrobacter sp. KY5]